MEQPISEEESQSSVSPMPSTDQSSREPSPMPPVISNSAEKKRQNYRSTISQSTSPLQPSSGNVFVVTPDTEEPDGPLNVDEYYMTLAYFVASRSKDTHEHVGACIVNPDNQVVSMSCNGFPKNCTMESMGYSKKKLKYRELFSCHAPLNAIVECKVSLKECKIYITDFPCHQCAKYIIQTGITSVYYNADKDDTRKSIDAAKRMLNAAGVHCKYQSVFDEK
ncbi:PREDICTED: deoxycytidylate deaminase-like isoform X2 [Nicrophorus vespilloides]|uniref:dCMP deaminase n=1 Tax=Nicrophorus vespilloides TaxID=110193 RepID=A0ABM1NEJ8_NICVS|nr:PREDICTED: deoxycytidylate deaminase-like isoform X2 [Nicrophorus vespilloides]